MTPYRWPGLSTEAWLNHRYLAGAVARALIREVVEGRAVSDPGPVGQWCREMIAPKETS
jgi:hypothetical protein